MRGRTKAVLGGGLALLLVGGGGLAWYLSQDAAPPPVTLADCTVDPGLDVEAAVVDGTWVGVPGEDSFVGYRIEEAFGGDTFLREIGGRTTAIDATLAVAGDEVTDVDVVADVTRLASDQPRRDRYLTSNGLETEEFPEASFTLGAPVALPTAPVPGKVFEVDAVGTLTLHGVAREVTVPVEGCWHGATIDVVGSMPLVLADHDIVPPNVPGLARAEPDGVLELQITFAPAP